MRATRSAILESLKHPHVVMLIDKILDKPEQKLYIVMEVSLACDGGGRRPLTATFTLLDSTVEAVTSAA